MTTQWIDPPKNHSTGEAVAAGRVLRSRLARRAQGTWKPSAQRADPLAVLHAGDAGRLADLLPIRYGRMVQNPFMFYRGAAAIMASDLSSLPVSGVRTWICGDCHLLNFGGFGTAENRFVFDVTDFDEATLGAWEWDVKRLVTSIVVAGEYLTLPRSKTRAAAAACVCAYREQTRTFAKMSVLDVWYARLDERRSGKVGRSAKPSRAHAFPRFVEATRGGIEIADEPPLLYHPPDRASFLKMVAESFAAYRETLPDERRALFDRFSFLDAAYKVVGVGSVGTRCLIALFVAGEDDLLVLQMKEARPSVFQTYAGAPAYASEGARVVTSQRALQAASDLFLGYAKASDCHDYYVRQLHDLKTPTNIEHMSALALQDYAASCGSALARAHSKASGCAPMLAGYLGRSPAFDQAIVEFAHAYARQNDRDHATLADAVRQGQIEVQHSVNAV